MIHPFEAKVYELAQQYGEGALIVGNDLTAEEQPTNNCILMANALLAWHGLPPEWKQPEERRSEWISVKDRMPEVGQEVLVCHVLGDRLRPEVPRGIDVAWYSGPKEEWTFAWCDRPEQSRPTWVTHWMPLPAPVL